MKKSIQYEETHWSTPQGTTGRDPLVAIVGRPNVGKSTLFNRLIGSRRSIVGDEPGITRDRLYGETRWRGRTLRLVDTGGIVPDEKDFIPAEIYRQAKVALEEAAALVMVVDGRTELASSDMELARVLIRSGKPVLLAVNKTDTTKQEAAAENFRQLGIKDVLPISAEHSLNIGELLDWAVDHVPASEPVADPTNPANGAGGSPDPGNRDREREVVGGEADIEGEADSLADDSTAAAEEAAEIKVAIIGRPNVGKSTLLNRMTRTSRAIVSPIAGTTRDAVDELLERDGKRYRFIDTAGIRRKGKTKLMAEKLSVVMALKHLEAADVALLLIDAVEGVTASDATIGGYAHESGRSVIIVINKWDLVTASRKEGQPPVDRKLYEAQVRRALKFLNYAPVVFISAASGKNTDTLFTVLDRVASERRKRVSTGEMNRFLKHVDFERASVPMSKRVRIYYMTQAHTSPPTFILFTDRAVKLHFSYQRFLENQIRAAFGFAGSPIWIKNRSRD